MAYQKKSPTVHAFKRIQEDLKSGNLKNLLMFYGRENYLIRWSMEQVKSRYINPAVEMFDYTVLDGAECGAGDIKSACETMPMMSEKRVVLLENFDFGGDYAEELQDYLENLPDTTVLLIICSSPDKRRKLFKTVQKKGAEYEFDRLDRPLLKSFIIKRLRDGGGGFDPDVPDMIADVSGYYDTNSTYTIENLINDISKVISHSREHISCQDVEETVSGNEARDVFAFSDALASGKKGKALSLLSDLLAGGQSHFGLLGLICSQFEVMLLVSEMRGRGMTPAAMHDATGLHEYRLKKTLPLASKYSTGRLRHILMKAYEVDRNIKTGLTEPRTALELFVAGV